MSLIRLANESDAAAILEIYAPYIESTSYTFETEVPSIEAFAHRINSYLINWPWLVCEIDKTIAGYAYATRYRERVAYQWCTESSVYVHDDYQRMGIAHTLYSTLIDILKRQGFRNVYAVINLPNDKSIAFHESLGYKHFATYEKVGYKLGKWKNVGWWQLTINDFINEPLSPVKFSELNKDFLPELFSQQSQKIRY
jgi:L-amino acid N-acyltransferase YncA